MKKILTILLTVFTLSVNAQKPMIGYSSDSIKMKSVELGVDYSSWKIDKTGDDFWMIYNYIKLIKSEVYYYFKYNNSKEENYLFSLISYDSYYFSMIKERTKKNCTYYGNGWYQQKESGLFVYFKSEIKENNIYYAMIYSGSPFIIYNYDL